MDWTGNTIPKYSGPEQKARVLIIQPVAFVSEHSETLVELDIEYLKVG